MCRFNLKAKGFRSDVHSENVSAVHVIKWAKQTKLRPNKIRRVSEVIRWIHKSCSDFYYRSSEIKTGWQPLLAGVQRSLMSHIVLLTCYFESHVFPARVSISTVWASRLNVSSVSGAAAPHGETFSRLREAQKRCQSDSPAYQMICPKRGRFWSFQWNMPYLFITM